MCAGCVLHTISPPPKKTALIIIFPLFYSLQGWQAAPGISFLLRYQNKVSSKLLAFKFSCREVRASSWVMQPKAKLRGGGFHFRNSVHSRINREGRKEELIQEHLKLQVWILINKHTMVKCGYTTESTSIWTEERIKVQGRKKPDSAILWSTWTEIPFS